MSLLLLVTFLFGFLRNTQATERFGCLNGSGQVVDWWVIYKQSSGYKYVYLDSTMDKPLGLSRKTINNVDSPIVRTVSSANYFLKSSAPTKQFKSPRLNAKYQSSQVQPPLNDPFYVSWNDQPKKGSTILSHAHAKVN